MRWKPLAGEIRPCETCGATLMRRRNAAGRLEGFRDFMRRRFCSLSCASSRNKGGQSRNAYLYHARKHLKKHCECCGAISELHAHHVNTDWTDNRPENIQTLCVFCHQFWHALHIRHGETPSKPMPKLRFPSRKTDLHVPAGSGRTGMPWMRKPRRNSAAPSTKSCMEYDL